MWIFITLVVVLLFAVRIMYLRFLFDDWNYYLFIFINKELSNSNYVESRIDYLREAKLEVYEHWWRVGRWQIKDFISNPLLIHDVSKVVAEKK